MLKLATPIWRVKPRRFILASAPKVSCGALSCVGQCIRRRSTQSSPKARKLDDVQQMIAKLQVDLEELQFQAKLYRLGVLMVFIFVGVRVWHYFF